MLLVGKQFVEEKIKLYHKQEGKCPLCCRPLNDDITSNHLDHDHAIEGENAGKVRALLCDLCNALEGQIKHKFVSSGLNSKGIDISDWLESLKNYYGKDLSDNPLHPQYVNDKAKWFSRLNKDEMIIELQNIGSEIPAKSTKASLSKLFKRQFKQYLKDNP